MRVNLFLIIVLFFASAQAAYPQNYETLLLERQTLLDQLAEAEAQTSSILGKKSKKDLKNTTEILKDIVEKDDEIITVLRKEVNKKIAAQQQTATATPENDQKIIELETQLANLNNLANQRNIKTAELQQEVATVKDRMFKYQSTILVTFFIIFLLAIYISRLRKKAKAKEKVVNG